MRRPQHTAEPVSRPARRTKTGTANRRKVVSSVAIALLLVVSATGGFLVGANKPETVEPVRDRSSIAAFENRLTEQETLCVEIEKQNLRAELDREKSLSDALAGTIEVKDKEMGSLEDKILKALMANLSEKTISRSSTTLDSYVKEAKNLLDLSRKLAKFKKTATSSQVDLTTYEKSIQKKLAYLPTKKPIPGVLEGYGMRIHPIFGYRQFHEAVDMGAPRGTPIKAAGAGTVIEAGYSSTSGNYIKISHGNGFTTAYLHCSKLNVKAGQTVTKGQTIATVGNTGTSTTSHLHFAIELNNNSLNPARIIME
jgi:murein DD-endopeptidase MepM/ murein hydrolase activator NlpD